jgi:NDP-sugar pyrophosphorylase family protein
MDAVILAAGLGTRLRPHTLHTPKPLLAVRGRPILDWTFGALPPVVDRVVVVVHYLSEQVERYLHEQKHFRDWQMVRQDEPQGTGDALRCCIPHLRKSPFLVLNGDDLYGAADLARLAGCRAGLLVHPVEEPRRFGIAFLRSDGTLEKLVEKPPLEGRHLANTGAYAFPPEVFGIELKRSPRGEYEITDYVSTLAQTGTVEVVQTNFWMPIGTEESWQAAQQLDLDSLMRGR